MVHSTLATSHGSSITVLGTERVEHVLAAQFSETSISVTSQSITDATPDDIIVVAQDVGAEQFTQAIEFSQTNGTLLVTIEFGGIGGYALDAVDATVSVFPPTGPCYHCLQTRLASADATESSAVSYPAGTIEYATALAGSRLLQAEDRNAMGHGECIELPHHKRTILPVPGCQDCRSDRPDRAVPKAEWSEGTRTLEAATRAGERAVDSRLGPITTIGEFTSIPLPYYLATVVDTARFSETTAPQQAAGVSQDWDVAFMKALGEALERYAAGIYHKSEFRNATPAAIDTGLDPNDVVRPSNNEPITAEIPWVRGIELLDDRPCWLPAELVHFPPPSSDIRPAITTGLGLGNSMVAATIAGLTEVIERDAMMLSWYSSAKPMGVRIDDNEFDRLKRRAAIESLDVTPILLTQDIDIPVIGVAVQREDEWPRVALGTAAALDATDAAIGALEEAIQNWVELENMGPERAASDASRIAAYATDPSPLMDYLSPTASVSAAGISHPVPDSPAAELEVLESLIVETDLSPAVSRITPRDLEALGFEAVRVVDPNAQPLFTGDPYFGDRARSVPESFGETPHLDKTAHPFP